MTNGSPAQGDCESIGGTDLRGARCGPENRRRYDRSHLRYEHNLTDEEWAVIPPEIPPAKPGGNKRTVGLREVVNGARWAHRGGCILIEDFRCVATQTVMVSFDTRPC
jgi:hypothetical protein